MYVIMLKVNGRMGYLCSMVIMWLFSHIVMTVKKKLSESYDVIIHCLRRDVYVCCKGGIILMLRT
jgi:hypothetical protein